MSKRNPEQESRRSELIVLFLLMGDERSGYQIRQLIRDWRIDQYLPVSPTTIYRALERLAAEKCVQHRRQRNGRYPTSTIYTITEPGRQRYRELELLESAFSRTSYSADVFLGLGAYQTEAERIEMARTWQGRAEARIADLDARIKDRSKEPGHTYGKAFSEWLLLDHERDLLKAEVKWFEKYVRLITTE